jgi:hypothetical protein
MSQDNEVEKTREEIFEYWSMIVATRHQEINILTNKLTKLNIDSIEKDYDISLIIAETFLATLNLYTMIKDYDKVKYTMWSLIDWCIEEIKFFDENGYWRFLEMYK